MSLISFLGILSVSIWLYLALAQGWFWLPLLLDNAPPPAEHPSVDIIVPARDEADFLPQTLPSLLSQDYMGAWRVILVDDHSNDDTASVARTVAVNLGKEDRLTVISAPELAEGWSGKVAAMNAGVSQSTADYILFTDADIRHAPTVLRQLVAKAEAGKLALVSRMVMLNCQYFSEQLLIPAFVFFFAMLYPFRYVNNPKYPLAAAAGGIMLLRRAILDKIGGLEAIKSALIDDCSLGKAVKNIGGKIELTLTRESESLRAYPHIKDIWRMVTRTAYTQLGFSPVLLVGCVLGLLLLFVAPPLFFIIAPTHMTVIAGCIGLFMILMLYSPMVKFYGLPWDWALTLPLAAAIYVAATVASARLYYQGKGGQWKGRTQA